jgi:hypothetical protein
MRQTVLQLLVGPPGDRSPLWATAVVVGLFVGVFLAYATGVFAVAGGVVFLAWDAAVVGFVAAALLSARRQGLVVAWAVTYVSLFGWSADHYLLGITGGLGHRLGALFDLDGLIVFAVQAALIGTLGWVLGRALRRGAIALDQRTA